MTTTILSPADYSGAVEQHHFEAADDMRRVIVGLEQESHQAEIYSRYAHLYTREQVESLQQAHDAAADSRLREELERLWLHAASAMAQAGIVEAAQELTNDRLSYRTAWRGGERSINELGASIASEPEFDAREELYGLMCVADEHFAPRTLELAARSQELRSEAFGLDGEVAIASRRMGIDVEAFACDIKRVATATETSYAERADIAFPELLGRTETHPSRAHAAYMRSLHLYDDVYTRERMVAACEATLAELGFPLEAIPTIKPDLEDRPTKSPRACVIATRVPTDVHLVVRPTGGLTDYQAFLHEAGHALHYGQALATLPYAFRTISRDFALTEIYSYVVERISHEPEWHVRHFDIDEGRAEQVCAHIRFVDASLFRRYAAKLQYELEFWQYPTDPRNPDRYAMLLSNLTRMRYPTSQYVSDMDPGLYAADYLRAWRTSEAVIAHLRRELGNSWFASSKAGDFLRGLFVRGTEPSNESVLEQIGSSAGDFAALTAILTR